ncbi:FmdB family zinc ribbon protein [Pantoea vagans]|uniref:FmdB family zinc ribbon protein n=1 Tax=Pantoea vagans TaxID=470934 RepID=UPI0023AFCC62|nr:FmdB family zinc ribbon protein [Pantoea vagans]MDE8559246.1 zinc ribbon domain-containing protein [Pantoea vagans]MDE8579246.1 zinc ribbon domain-containing protein [Pantoea vagans]
MPYYDYICLDCGTFEQLRSVAARDDPAPCPICQKSSDRKVSFQSVLLRSKPGLQVRNPLHVDGCPCCPGQIK